MVIYLSCVKWHGGEMYVPSFSHFATTKTLHLHSCLVYSSCYPTHSITSKDNVTERWIRNNITSWKVENNPKNVCSKFVRVVFPSKNMWKQGKYEDVQDKGNWKKEKRKRREGSFHMPHVLKKSEHLENFKMWRVFYVSWNSIQ